MVFHSCYQVVTPAAHLPDKLLQRACRLQLCIYPIMLCCAARVDRAPVDPSSVAVGPSAGSQASAADPASSQQLAVCGAVCLVYLQHPHSQFSPGKCGPHALRSLCDRVHCSLCGEPFVPACSTSLTLAAWHAGIVVRQESSTLLGLRRGHCRRRQLFGVLRVCALQGPHSTLARCVLCRMQSRSGPWSCRPGTC